MSFQELAILLPCHSLEDFPQHHEGSAADGLLANWTAMWHPSLLAAQEKGPVWHRADDPPENVTKKLLLIPAVSQPDLPGDFEERAKSQAAHLIVGETDREEIVQRVFAAIGQESEVDQELVADFFALGYCFLQIQLLTRQMRYSSNLDEGHFFQQVLAAARAADTGDSETAGEKIAACFDLLAE
jgi:alpha-mannosidase